MALIDDVKDELVSYTSDSEAVVRAQASAMIRFAGGLHIVKRHIVIEAQFAEQSVAEWLSNTIENVYHHDTELLQVHHQSPLGDLTRFSVRVMQQGGPLALETGLLTNKKQPVLGLPHGLLTGEVEIAKAAWRGAFLAHGELSDPGRASMLEIICPGYQSAIDMVKLAKLLDVNAQIRNYRNSQRVNIRDAADVERMLLLMGARRTSRDWSGKRQDGLHRGKANRLANFDDANMRRSAKAAVEAIAKVKHAFEVLGDDIPENLRSAGQVRLDHPDATLEELGRLSNPPISKDAVAGRIRRLFQLSDRVEAQRAEQQSE